MRKDISAHTEFEIKVSIKGTNMITVVPVGKGILTPILSILNCYSSGRIMARSNALSVMIAPI